MEASIPLYHLPPLHKFSFLGQILGFLRAKSLNLLNGIDEKEGKTAS